MLPQFRNAYSKPVVLREWTSSHGPVASGLPDTKVYQLLANLLEMHILRPHPPQKFCLSQSDDWLGLGIAALC